MTLFETFQIVRPRIVAFFSRLTLAKSGKPPLFPPIIGTGFFVHSDGVVATNRHVVEAFEKLPPHPVTGSSSAGLLLFRETELRGGETHMGMINVDIVGAAPLQEFEVDSPWFGESVPDLAFVQVRVRDVPSLEFLAEKNTLQIGRSVATAGFASGTDAIAFGGKLTQFTPILRHGIISSVFPFPGPNPHGFSIDALLQGGASGSPVFLPEAPLVIGMIESQLPSTNFTVALPAHLLKSALDDFLKSGQMKLEGVPTLKELIAASEGHEANELSWDAFVIPPPQPQNLD